MVYEMINVLVALRTWGKVWENSTVLVWCDNRAVVDILGRSRTKDGELGAILREILMMQAVCNIQLIVRHVRDESNPIADALSCVHTEKSVQCKIDLVSNGYEEDVVPRGVFLLNMEL